VNVRLSLHNVLMIGIIAVLFILAIRMASKTGAAQVPVLGSILKTGATA
jgi:hypothetical protein